MNERIAVTPGSELNLERDLSAILPERARSRFRRHVDTCRRCIQRWARAVQLTAARQDPHPSSNGMGEEGWGVRGNLVPYTSMLTPLGLVWIAVGSRGLVRVASDEDEVAFCDAVERAGCGVPTYMPGYLDGHARQFTDYFAGRRTRFEIAVDLGRCGGFRRNVLEAVQEVPYGTVQSYGDIAHAVGRPRAARAVGTALRGNSVAFAVPCHRIVRSDGTIGEYGDDADSVCGVECKRMLLAIEGVIFAD